MAPPSAFKLAKWTLAVLALMALLTTILERGGKSPPSRSWRETLSSWDFALNLMGIGLESETAQITPQKEFLVVGAGLSRTGTRTQKRTLEMLGYKVLHTDGVTKERLGDLYREALRSPSGFDAFCSEALCRGYNATLDITFSLLLPQFIERYPKAKIFYATRELDSWARSFSLVFDRFIMFHNPPFADMMNVSFVSEAIERYGYGMKRVRVPCRYPPLSWYSTLFNRQYYCSTDFTMDLKNFYRLHEESVMKLVAESGKERDLLRFDVREGWDHILDFFGMPSDHALRGKSLPKENDGNGVNSVGDALYAAVVVFPVAVLGVVVALLGVFTKACKRIINKSKKVV